MTIQTATDRRYYLRFLLIGFAALAFALWSLYDGAVKYPRLRDQAAALRESAPEGGDGQAHANARQHGRTHDPHDGTITDVDIEMQYIMGGVSAVVGILFLLVVFRSRGRWIEATESGLESSWGQQVPFDQILSLNKKRWREKGIATIKYQHGKRRKRFVLDNYKYDRHTTNMILREIEARIGPDKIVGGPPEPPPEEPGDDPSTGSP